MSASRPAAVIVLAAGEGTRMKSRKTPKVLHELCGRSMLGHVLAAGRDLHPDRLIVVVGHGRDRVTDHLAEVEPEAVPVVQAEQNGTGHAVRMVLEAEVTEGIRLRANRELIGQALVNLVDNAMKYAGSRAGAPGRITLSAKAENGRVQLIVADNGPGIPEADRARVVERFVRLEESRTEPGSGLGLSLVAAVARLHRGEFRIEDNNPGVRAVIDLPAS